MDTTALDHQQPDSLLDHIEALTLSHERARMSREIHDGMGQHLHAAKLLAEALVREDTTDPRRVWLLQAVQAAQREARRAITALLDRPS